MAKTTQTLHAKNMGWINDDTLGRTSKVVTCLARPSQGNNLFSSHIRDPAMKFRRLSGTVYHDTAFMADLCEDYEPITDIKFFQGATCFQVFVHGISKVAHIITSIR
jgi:hypothetical protein